MESYTSVRSSENHVIYICVGNNNNLAINAIKISDSSKVKLVSNNVVEYNLKKRKENSENI